MTDSATHTRSAGRTEPPPVTEPHGKGRRLTPEQALAFRTLQPAALCLVATDGPVSMTLYDRSGEIVRRIGHNRGVWPAKIARTSSWKDTVTATYDKAPFHFVGAQFRLWFLTEQDRDRVAEGTVELISRRADEDGSPTHLLHDFQDLGPELDLELFEYEVADMAKRLGTAVWSDVGLIDWLDRVMSRARRWEMKKGVRLSERALADLIERAALRELGR